MIQIINLLFYYFLCIFSIVGYGMIFNSGKKNLHRLDFGLLGLTGVLILIFLSYLTNFFFKHNYIHNSIIILVGFSIFIYNIVKHYKKIKINFYSLIIIFSILFIGLIMYKNHDDFFYYHFQYTLSLVDFKKIFGLGILEHGYRTPSAIFYLNSLFYLPGIKFYLLNSGAIFIFGFSNIFLINKTFSRFHNKNYDSIFFLSILAFIYINTAFYRIAEHGTDRSSLILIFIFAIIYLESISFKNKQYDHDLKNYYEKMIIIITLIISFKSFYLIYGLFIFIWMYEQKNFSSIKQLINIIFKNNFTYLCFFSIFAVIFTTFSNTGCLVYPLSFTCFENFSWSLPTSQVEQMKSWYELWSKSGADPNNRVSNPELYIQGLNWLSHWVNNYFFTKVSDFLFVLFLISFICIFYLRPSKRKTIKKNKIDFKLFYFMIIFFTLEWFYNHPALRYGGYTLIALLVFIPISIYLSKFTYDSNKLKKKIIILFLLSLSIYMVKNYNRILFESEKYNFKPLTNPYFHINSDGFKFGLYLKSIQNKFYPNNTYKFIIINKEIINKLKNKN